jgi:hypothetical protein
LNVRRRALRSPLRHMLAFGCDFAALGILGLASAATWKLGAGLVASLAFAEQDKAHRHAKLHALQSAPQQQEADDDDGKLHAATAAVPSAPLAESRAGGDDFARLLLVRCTVVSDAGWVHVALMPATAERPA